MRSERAIRVVLADDHQILREGVRALLEASSLRDSRRVVVVGESASGSETLVLCSQLRPEVAVLDISFPDISGLDVAEQLRQSLEAPAVVILSMHDSPQSVWRARRLGAAAYLVKGSGVAELAEAIARAANGGTGPFPDVSPSTLQLSHREREVLGRVANGLSNKEIAEKLGISMHTVNSHRAHLMRKLDVHDVASLTRIAVRLGLTG